jgi:uncharacterized membrane protein YkoI
LFFFEKLILILVLIGLPIAAAFAGEQQVSEPSLERQVENTEDTALLGKKNIEETPVVVAKPNNPQKEGKTVWLEKKLSPPTRWLENVVKPITTWMERKIQKEVHGSEEPVETLHPARGESDEDPLPTDEHVIDSERIAELASNLIPGQILRIKLLNRTPLQYRVKLISHDGEIHIIYINAHTGIIIQPLTESAEDS